MYSLLIWPLSGGILLYDPNGVGCFTTNAPKVHDITLKFGGDEGHAIFAGGGQNKTVRLTMYCFRKPAQLVWHNNVQTSNWWFSTYPYQWQTAWSLCWRSKQKSPIHNLLFSSTRCKCARMGFRLRELVRNVGVYCWFVIFKISIT